MKVNFIPNTFGVLFLTAFMIFLSALLYALPLWLVWNWTIPKLFNGPALSILDAFLLNILTGILFRAKDKQ
ncbi:MAG: hypothetical protein ABIJ34_04710 [archaeon]